MALVSTRKRRSFGFGILLQDVSGLLFCFRFPCSGWYLRLLQMLLDLEKEGIHVSISVLSLFVSDYNEEVAVFSENVM